MKSEINVTVEEILEAIHGHGEIYNTISNKREGNKISDFLEINYDKEYDILYITICKNEPSLADEKNGYLIRKSLKDGKLTGITIFDFKKKYGG